MKNTLEVLLVCFAGPAVAGECKGDMGKVHRVGNFNFETNSWVEQVGDLYRYISCVRNLDTSNDLLIHWFIPGPYREWVPPDEAVPQPRMSEDGQARPLDGCIEYGHLGERTIAQFMGNGADQDATNSDEERACRVAAKSPVKVQLTPINFPPDGWTEPVRFFFPSDAKRPKESMLVLEGTITLKPDDKGYINSFEYEIRPYEGRPDGDPEGILVKPFFPTESDFFLSAMKEAFTSPESPSVALSANGKITFFVPQTSERWIVTAGYYEFIDKNSETVAILRVPLFAPEPS